MKIRICSANIRFDNPKDGVHDWAGRREILSNFLNSMQLDLFGTQEGLQPQIYDLLSLIPGFEISDSHRQWIIDRMYPSIFYSQKLEVQESGDIWLSETPNMAATKSFGSAFPRLCTWTKFKNIDLLYVNLHLDHLKTSTRQEQAKVLVNEVSKINNCKYLILTGDFNESPNEEVMNIVLKGLSLYDPWIKLNKIEQASHHDFGKIHHEASRIDWILLSKNIVCKDIKLYTDHLNNIYPSDHFPVYAQIELI